MHILYVHGQRRYEMVPGLLESWEQAGHRLEFDAVESFTDTSARICRPDIIFLEVVTGSDIEQSAVLSACQTGSPFVVLAEECVSSVCEATALQVGARDFIRKGAAPQVVSSRIGRSLSIEMNNGGSNYSSSLRLDAPSRSVVIEGKKLVLAPKEYRVFEILAQSPGQTVCREDLLTEREIADGQDPRIVDSSIKRIRQRMAKIEIESLELKATYGVGYSLELLNG